MGEVLELFGYGEGAVARRHVERWKRLISQFDKDSISKYAGSQGPMTWAKAVIVGRVLLRLGQDSRGYLSLEEIEIDLFGPSESTIRKAIGMAESPGILYVHQKRRGGPFRIKYIESGIEKLETKLRFDCDGQDSGEAEPSWQPHSEAYSVT